jgi:hypothetical protein
MVSDNRLCPMIAHDHGVPMITHDYRLPMITHDYRLPMITHDYRLPMIAHDGLLSMIPDHGTATTVVAVTSRRPFVCGNKGEAGRERDGHPGDGRFHRRAPLLGVRSLRDAPLGVCVRDHEQNVSAYSACSRLPQAEEVIEWGA